MNVHLPPAFGGPEPVPELDHCDLCGGICGPWEAQFGGFWDDRDWVICERCGWHLWGELVGDQK